MFEILCSFCGAKYFLQVRDLIAIIDFRNGRYQGETRQQLPHGFGFYLDKSFALCAGEWLSGTLSGEAMIIFRLGGVYCGSIRLGEPHGISLYEMAEDGVRLYWLADRRGPQRVAAVMPFIGLILDIDNSNPELAKVSAEYAWSLKEQQNSVVVSKILHLGREEEEKMKKLTRFEHYFESSFSKNAFHIFESLHRRRADSYDIFLGMKNQGLGLSVQRNPFKTQNPRKHHRSYIVRQMGYFSKESQLRDIGLRVIDNPMKGYVLEEGIFGQQKSVVAYEQGKRPGKAAINFHNHLKRSLFYRDMVLPTDYIFRLRDFVWSFDKNLRRIETERLAQSTIENTGKGQQRHSREKGEKETHYNPYDVRDKLVLPLDGALFRVKYDTVMNASKSKNASSKFLQAYQHPQYVDPNTNAPRHEYYQPYWACGDSLHSSSPPRKSPQTYQNEEPTYKYGWSRQERQEPTDSYSPYKVRNYSPRKKDYEQLGRGAFYEARSSPRKVGNHYNYNYLEPAKEYYLGGTYQEPSRYSPAQSYYQGRYERRL